MLNILEFSIILTLLNLYFLDFFKKRPFTLLAVGSLPLGTKHEVTYMQVICY